MFVFSGELPMLIFFVLSLFSKLQDSKENDTIAPLVYFIDKTIMLKRKLEQDLKVIDKPAHIIFTDKMVLEIDFFQSIHFRYFFSKLCNQFQILSKLVVIQRVTFP